MRLFRRSPHEPSVRVRELEASEPIVDGWRIPLPLASAGAALITAAAGWLIVAVVCFIAWITVPAIKIRAVAILVTKGWLVAHGISVTLPGSDFSLTPLGLTLLIGAIMVTLITQAVRRTRLTGAWTTKRIAASAAIFSGVYAIVLAAATSWTSVLPISQFSLVRAVLITVLVAVGALLSATHHRPWEAWIPEKLPDWAPGLAWMTSIGRAIAASLGVMVAFGGAAVTAAMIASRDRMDVLFEALQPGIVGGVMLTIGLLAWVPNVVLWGAAWCLGAGVQLGYDTIISPAMSRVGMLPGIPIFGAVPSAGPMPTWMLLWLVSGVIAGAVAGYIVVKNYLAASNPKTLRLEMGPIVGALAGIVSGLAFTVVQACATGDLGSVRLVDLGARMKATLIMAPTAMGVGGMVIGLVVTYLAMRRIAASG